MEHEQDLAQLLSRISARYRSLTGYRDRGEQESVTITGPQSWERHTSRKRFRTLFSSPDRYLFEYREVKVGPEEEWTRCVAWQLSASSGARTWSTMYEDPEVRPLAAALSALAGVSGGTSWPVAMLLGIAQEGPGQLPDAATWRIAEHCDLDGVACVVLEGPVGLSDAVRMWFEEEALLLRRMENRHEHNQKQRERQAEAMNRQIAGMAADDPHRSMLQRAVRALGRRNQDFVSETVTTWYPEANVAIALGEFEFSSPVA